MQTSDVLVIGGGIAGIGAAAMLAPDARVTVLEAEDAPGHHSTGRSAAIFIRNYGGPVLRALNAASEPFFLDPGDLTEGPLLSPRGEMLLAEEDELDALAAYMDGAEGMERITAAEAVEMVPILRPERIAAASVERDARDIDVDRLFQGWIRRLRGQAARSSPAQGFRGSRARAVSGCCAPLRAIFRRRCW
jgi:D-arginine dehydrogenase